MPPAPIGPQVDLGLPHSLLHTLSGHSGSVLAVRYNTQGTYCLSCGKDRTLVLWNPAKGLKLRTFTGHGYDVRDAAILADNSKFASCGGDRQVFLWDVATAAVVRKFRGHEGVVNSVAVGAGGAVLVTAGDDRAVKVWDCRSRSQEPIQEMRVFRDAVMSATMTTASEIIAGSVDGTVRRFDIRLGRVYTDLLHCPVASVALSSDENCVLAACLDSTLRLLDKADGDLLGRYTGHTHTAIRSDAAFMPNDAHVVCAAEDGVVRYWDLVEASVVQSFRAHPGAVTSLSVHPGGRQLLTASSKGDICVWSSL